MFNLHGPDLNSMLMSSYISVYKLIVMACCGASMQVGECDDGSGHSCSIQGTCITEVHNSGRDAVMP